MDPQRMETGLDSQRNVDLRPRHVCANQEAGNVCIVANMVAFDLAPGEKLSPECGYEVALIDPRSKS
jgi:hypothetical protein